MSLYIVTATEKFQAAGDYPSQFEIEAKNKKEAIAEAKKRIGWRSRYDGPIAYKAELA